MVWNRTQERRKKALAGAARKADRVSFAILRD
jgi:hypothetical protein